MDDVRGRISEDDTFSRYTAQRCNATDGAPRLCSFPVNIFSLFSFLGIRKSLHFSNQDISVVLSYLSFPRYCIIPEVVFGDPDRCPAPQYTLFPIPKLDFFRFWCSFFLFSGKHRILTISLYLRKSKKLGGCMICFVCSFFRKWNKIVPVFRKIRTILMDKGEDGAI